MKEKKYIEPTAADVLAILKGESEQKPEKKTRTRLKTVEDLDVAVDKLVKPIPFSDMTQDELDVFANKAPAQEAEDKIAADTPMPQEFALPTTSDNIDFTMDFAKFGTLEVKDIERDLYMKAVLNDANVRFPVEVMPGFSMVVRARTVYFDDLVYEMVRQSDVKGEILGLESGFTKLMRLLAAVQVVSLKGNNVEFVKPEGVSRPEVAMALLQHSSKVFDNLPLPIWNAVVWGVQIFDAKLKVCNDRLLDRTFWTGADTV